MLLYIITTYIEICILVTTFCELLVGKMISIKNLSKEYNGKEVIKNLSLEIEKGEFISVVGPNGCGKTTLMRCIAGIIGYGGTIDKKSDNIGYVGQNPEKMLLP